MFFGKNKKQIIIVLALAIILLPIIFFSAKDSDGNLFNEMSSEEANIFLGVGGSNDNNTWQIFEGFNGYQTKADPQKITVGANPMGQNTLINDGDRITARDFGFEIFPSTDEPDANVGAIISIHTFRKRDGENIIIRANDNTSTTTLEYYKESVGVWETLRTGYATGAEFGFADHNTNLDQTSYTYFGNAVQNYSRWTGNVGVLSAIATVGAGVLTVDSTLLFPTSGTVIMCGTEYAYASKTDTTFTLSGTVTEDCDEGRGVAQVPQEFAGAPKGNILKVLNTRMFVAGVASTTQSLFYSRIADASNFTFSSPRNATDGGIINMPEGGGGITGIAIDEEVMYVFKRNYIKSVTFTQDALDLPVVKPLKPFDGKSQTVGAVSQKSIFAGGNGIFFITPNNEIMNLSRVPDIDYPQVVPISDIIKPTTDNLIWDSSAGVFWKNKAYFSAKTKGNTLEANDVVLIWNTAKNSWESPIVGLNVSDWAIAKFGLDDELFFSHSIERNVYKVTNSRSDNGFGFASNWRSREETFGAPHFVKSIDMFYVEGYIDANTKINVSLLLDEDGYTNVFSTVIDGANIDKYTYDFSGYNLFGLNPFGFERFGSNADFTGLKKFRIYYGRGVSRIQFHSLQIEFASDGENQNWEILRYGYAVQLQPNPIPSNLLKAL
jgi:hypothetical protein